MSIDFLVRWQSLSRVQSKGKRKLSGRVYDGATKSEDYARDG